MRNSIKINTFKEFQNNHKKIVPALTDDWELYTSSLVSQKLNQRISIEPDEFLDFVIQNKVQLKLPSITGNFIIGNDRMLHTEDEYSTYLEKFAVPSKRVKASELVPGSEVTFLDGSKYIFIGFAYKYNLKTTKKIPLFTKEDANIFKSFNHKIKDIKTQGKKVMSDETVKKAYIRAFILYHNVISPTKLPDNIDAGEILVNNFTKDEIIEKYFPKRKDGNYYIPTKSGLCAIKPENATSIAYYKEDRILELYYTRGNHNIKTKLILKVPKSLYHYFILNGVND